MNKQIIIDKDKFEKAENEPINHEAVNKFIEETNKFYIDGVDVSECIRRNDFKLASYDCHLDGGCQCKDNPNCYYKNYKRKEQECENNKIAYKNELDIYNQECFNLQEELKETLEQFDQLKAENEELKEKYKWFDHYKEQALYNKNLYNEKSDQIDQLKKENEELKKTVNDLLHKPEIQNKIFWKIDNEKLLLSKDTYIYKLEKTLQEIKEIAENISKLPANRPYDACMLNKQILQKIHRMNLSVEFDEAHSTATSLNECEEQ